MIDTITEEVALITETDDGGTVVQRAGRTWYRPPIASGPGNEPTPVRICAQPDCRGACGGIVRTIRLPNGRTITLGGYVTAWKNLLKMGASLRSYTMFVGWNEWGETAEHILVAMREGMHDRINRRLTGYGIGRKWSSDWQRHTAQDAQRLNTPRLIVRRTEVSPWLRSRIRADRFFDEEG